MSLGCPATTAKLSRSGDSPIMADAATAPEFKQAKFTLEQLHAGLGGKILDNKAQAKRLAEGMKHVEAVL